MQQWAPARSHLYRSVVHHEAPVLHGAVRHEGDVEVVVGGEEGVGHGGHVPTVPAHYSTVQYSTVQYSTVQYSTVPAEHGGVAGVPVPDLQVVVHAVPAALDIEVPVSD